MFDDETHFELDHARFWGPAGAECLLFQKEKKEKKKNRRM